MDSFYIILHHFLQHLRLQWLSGENFEAVPIRPAPQEAKRCTAACRARRAAPFTSCDVHIQVISMVDKHMLS